MIPAPSLGGVLARAAAALAERPCPALRLIVGNMSCDLDSVASALGMGMYYAATAPRNVDAAGVAAVPVPVVRASRDDLRLRAEVMYSLRACGIDPGALVHMDTVGEALRARTASSDAANNSDANSAGLWATLVDHNEVDAPELAAAGAAVDAVVDHHHDAGGFRGAQPRLIEPAGSCASHVALLARDAGAGANVLDTATAKMLLLAILADTINLSEAHGRVTDKDRCVWMLGAAGKRMKGVGYKPTCCF
jgi:exopolyphosphatase